MNVSEAAEAVPSLALSSIRRIASLLSPSEKAQLLADLSDLTPLAKEARTQLLRKLKELQAVEDENERLTATWPEFAERARCTSMRFCQIPDPLKARPSGMYQRLQFWMHARAAQYIVRGADGEERELGVSLYEAVQVDLPGLLGPTSGPDGGRSGALWSTIIRTRVTFGGRTGMLIVQRRRVLPTDVMEASGCWDVVQSLLNSVQLIDHAKFTSQEWSVSPDPGLWFAPGPFDIGYQTAPTTEGDKTRKTVWTLLTLARPMPLWEHGAVEETILQLCVNCAAAEIGDRPPH